jgi:hypothetical protein
LRKFLLKFPTRIVDTFLKILHESLRWCHARLCCVTAQLAQRHCLYGTDSPTTAAQAFRVREAVMRRVLLLAALGILALSNTGCFINIYSSDPNRRINELLNNSEDLRQIEYEWERIWFTDEPSHMTPERVHGGIQ